MTTPSPSTQQRSSNSSQAFWFFVLAASLLLNAFVLFYKKDKSGQILASGQSQSFRWRDVSVAGQNLLQNLDGSYYSVLKSEAELWAENLVLPKEAQSKGVAVDALLKSEVSDKVAVSDEEVQERYTHAPTADASPYPQVLGDIRNEIFSTRYADAKKAYLGQLFAKYGVQFKIPVPKNFQENKNSLLQFPEYVPPKPENPLNAQGMVVAAPSTGPADAPVVIEIFSDFMCPYSKRFQGTLQGVRKKYTDKVRIIYHHFPLPFHPGADLMAEASVCAQEQGKFWEYHDRLMAQNDKLEKDGLIRLGGELGLNAAKFQGCMDSGRYKPWVDSEIDAAKKIGVSGTPSFMINGRKSFGALPIEMVAPMIDWHLKPEGQYPGTKAAPPQPGGPAGMPQGGGPRLDPQKTYPIPDEWLKKGIVRGPENAPVAIVEFMDYNCPFCQRGGSVIDQLWQKYPGKIRLYPRNFPLPMHPNAHGTAEAVLCANAQGKFWEFRSQVFGDFWGKQSPQDMKEIAKKIGLNESDFSSCVDSGKMKTAVDEDVKFAQDLGVGSTPTFFVNGKPVVGAQPVENFEKSIDEVLSAKKN